ncbi:MAG: hypothetical protein PWQ22_543 [Archaeoglobaceae archaeon]|nr:hypothetical protein [Archaeoglobaceae archaeon]MDK2876133.1 hypothetical protein [Archaeoglobaceae archaeon]
MALLFRENEEKVFDTGAEKRFESSNAVIQKTYIVACNPMIMDVLLDPDKFFSERKNMGFKIPILIVLVSAVISCVSVYVTIDLNLSKIPAEGLEVNTLRTIMLTLGIVTAFIGTFIYWIIIAGLLYLFSAIFGGKGDFKTLLKFTAFSYIPQILLSPISIYLAYESLYQLTVSQGPAFEAMLMPTIFGAVVLFWQYIYWIFAVKNARELNFSRSAISAGILLIIAISFTALGLLFALMTPMPRVG